MTEELTEEHDGVNGVSSKWTHGELDGKTVCLTEKGGREDILWIGVIHAQMVGDEPKRLVARITAGQWGCDMDQDMTEALRLGSGRLVADFHISTPMLDAPPQSGHDV